MRAIQRLRTVEQAYVAYRLLWDDIKRHIQNGMVLRLEIKPDTRTLEQNDRFHAMCEDIAKSGFKWQGKARTKDQWKVLLVSAHAVETGDGAEMIPGLEGEFVNIRESTAQMSVARSSSLIEYTQAWGDQNGIRWRAENRAVEA
jgi:hypothetical protein